MTVRLFEGELQGVAHSIAEDDFRLYHGTKSTMKDHFNKCPEPDTNEQSTTIVELSPIVFKYSETQVDTFNDFAVLLYYRIMELGYSDERIDIVCDRYFKDSLKEQIRNDRGVGTRFLFSDETPFPKNFRNDFLQCQQSPHNYS